MQDIALASHLITSCWGRTVRRQNLAAKKAHGGKWSGSLGARFGVSLMSQKRSKL